MQDEKLVEEICAARFSEIPGHWTDGLTPGIIAIERMKAERLLPIIARERENAAAAQKERDAAIAEGYPSLEYADIPVIRGIAAAIRSAG